VIVESEAELAQIVRNARTVAVVGMKDERDAEAPAHTIPRVMQARGVRVIPVNPGIAEALGERAYARLADVAEPFDVVQIFRRSEAIGAVADEILALPAERRPSVVWMQTGIKNDEAAARLGGAGLGVVMDRCFSVYAARYRAQQRDR
jgi:uncharacterized protein